MIARLHDRIYQRRIRVLAGVLAELVRGDSILDVGTGSGDLGAMIAQRAGARVIGIDTYIRPRTAFPVQPYDGSFIPFPDKSFDTVLLMDVLHHIPSREGIRISLAEATRVAKACVLIKDRVAESPWDLFVLSAMDRVGNARFRVKSPGNYLNKKDWQAELGRLPCVLPHCEKIRPLCTVAGAHLWREQASDFRVAAKFS